MKNDDFCRLGNDLVKASTEKEKAVYWLLRLLEWVEQEFDLDQLPEDLNPGVWIALAELGYETEGARARALHNGGQHGNDCNGGERAQ